MMCLIKIVDGKPFEHPMLVDNYLQAFPDTDLQNLPEGLAWFERKLRPELPSGTVFVSEDASYEFDGKVWTDVWHIRDMTEEEKAGEFEEFISSVRKLINLRLEEYTGYLPDCKTDADTKIVQDYIAALNVSLSELPGNTEVPPPPKRNAEGNWTDLNSSGSVPNVIS